ncbi:MAG: tRNA (N(6)-L-threonylcarbamoyladenosine(37)-C(2))-methylthiotransferase MtaB [Pseudomonadota bacterium]
MPKKKAAVHVLGCKVNQAEAAAMTKMLVQQGFLVDPDESSPDLVLVNTCCVTGRAEGKSRRLISRLARRFPEATLVVTGCLAAINPDSVRQAAGNTTVLVSADKAGIALLTEEGSVRSTGPTPNNRSFTDLGPAAVTGRARAFLKVQDGCSQRCTYCIVPHARGPSRSLDPDRVLHHAVELEAAGFAEIVLTGVHLGAYGRDLNPRTSLEELLERLLRGCRVPRFRLSSIEPQDITDRLISLMAVEERICPHLHVPLQSGDDSVLRRMARPYDTDGIRALLMKVHHASPDACIGMDVMVGFPGEDDPSFERTRELIAEIRPAYLHVFPFSPRPGTPAASFTPAVPQDVAHRRVEQLRILSMELRREFYSRFLGRVLPAVAESDTADQDGYLTARTDNYIRIRVAGWDPDRTPHRFLVGLESIQGEVVMGTIADDVPAAG